REGRVPSAMQAMAAREARVETERLGRREIPGSAARAEGTGALVAPAAMGEWAAKAVPPSRTGCPATVVSAAPGGMAAPAVREAAGAMATLMISPPAMAAKEGMVA